MSGFGTQSYGTSPYGVGTPAVATPLGGSVLRNPYTSKATGSRYIDPGGKDYVLDANGRILGMDDVQQLVLMAVSTTKGSSAMRTLGHELQQIDRITPNFARRADRTLRAAVQHLVDRKMISVVGTSVTVGRPGFGQVSITWRDLSTNTENETRV